MGVLGGDFGTILKKVLRKDKNKHDPRFTKHRKNKGQFKRKQNHWSQNATKN